MFSKKKKKPQISTPSNFEHRVHTGFDKREGRYVGLPLQWASIVGNNQILKSTNRPLPLVDPSHITFTEILDLKTIVRPHHLNNNHKLDDTSQLATPLPGPASAPGSGGIVLPKTSHVARSNSLRSSSPPRMRRDIRGNSNVPPSVPEEPTPSQLAQFPSMRRDPNYTSKSQLSNGQVVGEWNGGGRPPAAAAASIGYFGDQSQGGQNGNIINPINVHIDIPHQFRYANSLRSQIVSYANPS